MVLVMRMLAHVCRRRSLDVRCSRVVSVAGATTIVVAVVIDTAAAAAVATNIEVATRRSSLTMTFRANVDGP